MKIDPTCQLSQLLTSHFNNNIIIIIPVPKEDLNKSFIKSVTGVFGSPSLSKKSYIEFSTKKAVKCDKLFWNLL